MNSPGLNPEKYRHDLEVVRNTALQVIKDFGLAGIEVTFSGNTTTVYKELLHQVTPALVKLLNQNREAFMSLLYRIDVDEKKVTALIDRRGETDIGIELAELVIEREFLKVLTRKLYSNRNGYEQ